MSNFVELPAGDSMRFVKTAYIQAINARQCTGDDNSTIWEVSVQLLDYSCSCWVHSEDELGDLLNSLMA